MRLQECHLNLLPLAIELHCALVLERLLEHSNSIYSFGGLIELDAGDGKLDHKQDAKISIVANDTLNQNGHPEHD